MVEFKIKVPGGNSSRIPIETFGNYLDDPSRNPRKTFGAFLGIFFRETAEGNLRKKTEGISGEISDNNLG